jgi:DNA polymerase-3 subunit gamma/tau
MNHLVLARKYRPQLFDQVVGQDVIVATLKAALQKNRMAHALLFTGGRGIGKTTIARIVAKALVCVDRQEAEPCGACVQCLAVDTFSSLDVIEIDGASHTGVDDVRELRDSARYQPTSAKYKIYIIDEVHMLSTSAFNALLKIVEEPPPHVIFMFATTEVHKIPKTILSRCQRYDLKRMSVDSIFMTLKTIMGQEGLSFEENGLLLIAQLADGGMRDALSMAEQVIAQKRENYSALDVSSALGVVGHQAIRDLSSAIITGHVEPALKIIHEVYNQGLDICHMMDSLTERFRALSLCAHLDDVTKAQSIVPGLMLEDFQEAKNFDPADLKRLFAMALDSMTQVFQARKPLLALELFVLRVALRPAMSDAATINFCLQKLEALVHNRPLPKAQPPQAPSLPAVVKPMVNKPTVNKPTVEPAKPASLDPKNLGAQFERLVEDLAQSAPGIASYLRHARPYVSDDKILKLNFELSLYYEKLLNQKNNPVLVTALAKIFGPDLKFELILDKAPHAEIKTVKTVAEAHEAGKIAQAEALRAQAEEHPIIKKALEIFGANIADVKSLNTHDVV